MFMFRMPVKLLAAHCPYCLHLPYPHHILHRPLVRYLASENVSLATQPIKEKHKVKRKSTYTDVMMRDSKGGITSKQRKIKKLPASTFLKSISSKSVAVEPSITRDISKELEQVQAALEIANERLQEATEDSLASQVLEVTPFISKAISHLLSAQYILDQNNLVNCSHLEEMVNVTTQLKYSNIPMTLKEENAKEVCNKLKLSVEALLQLNERVIREWAVKENNAECIEEEEGKQFGDVFIDEQIQREKKKPVTKKVQEVTAKVKKQHLDSSGREFSLKNSLGAYLQVCVETDLLDTACRTLKYYRQRANLSQNIPRVRSIKLDNIILRCHAAQGNLEGLKDWLEYMKQDDAAYDINTFSAIFECIGRQERDETEFAKEMHQRMTENGFLLEDLLHIKPENRDDRKSVMRGIKLVQSDVEAALPFPPTDYIGTLLQDIDSIKSETSLPRGGLINVEASTKEQISMEVDGEFTVDSIVADKNPSKEVLQARERLSDVEEGWRKQIEDAFIHRVECWKNRNQYVQTVNQTGLRLLPYLLVLPPHEYVACICKEIRALAQSSDAFSSSTRQLKKALGFKVLQRYRLQCKSKQGIVEKLERVYKSYCRHHLMNATPQRKQWVHLSYEDAEGPSLDLREKNWPTPVLLSLGEFLYDILLKDITVDPTGSIPKFHSCPAFYTIYRHHGPVVREEIKTHPELVRMYRESMHGKLTFAAVVAPMVVPPLPWISQHTGGYLLHQVNVVRFLPGAVQQRAELGKASPQQLFPMLDSLNQLGSVPWKVNGEMLDVVIELFKSGGDPDLSIPCTPNTDHAIPNGNSEDEQAVNSAIKKKEAEMYSQWCDMLYKLSIANHYRNRVVWFPHNMDFRGRVYPCPPHFSHIGSDVSRSLLKFASGKALGEKGLDWLKIHLINLTGKKKRSSLIDRLKYADEMLPEILDSADHPLKGRRWWMESDEPWQTLAVCKEIAAAVRSDDPCYYISHVPVHQDGSCNGLQHYASLGRDIRGAESVNLAPASFPHDVYSTFASLIENERRKDAEEDLKVAKTLEGFVTRKVIKQTVMTTVYGVTRYGGRLQIARQLKDIKSFPNAQVFAASSYLVGKVFLCLREMFTSAREIQDWLTSCAQLISQVCGQNVEWVTPLGLPVVQPYANFVKPAGYGMQITGAINPFFSSDLWSRPNIQKQKNAFPPNFIHSLDSTHMMLTSLYCQRLGIEFVSVHDCFWTHAADVDVMNKVCRQQFVSLHSQPILEDLSHFLLKKFGYDENSLRSGKKTRAVEAKQRLNEVLKQVPAKGDFDLQQVLNSTYFFS